MAVCVEAQTASFPSAVVTDNQLKVAANNCQTTVTFPVGASDTSIQVANASCIAANSLATIDNEIVAVCGKSGNTLSIGQSACPDISGRGFDSTTATTHAATGANCNPGTASGCVSLFIDAWHRNSDRVEIEAIETALGANLSNIPSTGANKTLSNLTAPTAIATHLIPGANNTYNLGSSSGGYWASLMANGVQASSNLTVTLGSGDAILPAASGYTVGSSGTPFAQFFAAPNNPFDNSTHLPGVQATINGCNPETLRLMMNGGPGITAYPMTTCITVPSSSVSPETGALSAYVLNKQSGSGIGVPLSAMGAAGADNSAVETNTLIADYNFQFCPTGGAMVTLASNINSSATTIPLSCAAASQFGAPSHIAIGSENIEICAASGSTLTTCSSSGNYSVLNPAVSAASESGTTVSLTVSSIVGYSVGQSVFVSGISPSGYTGYFTLTSVSGTTLQYTAAASLGAATPSGAKAQPANCTGTTCYTIVATSGTFPAYLTPYAQSNTQILLAAGALTCTIAAYDSTTELAVNCGSAPSASSWSYNGRGSQGTSAASQPSGAGVIQIFEGVTANGIEYDMNNYSASSSRIAVEIGGGAGVPDSIEVQPSQAIAVNVEGFGTSGATTTKWATGYSTYPGCCVVGLGLGPSTGFGGTNAASMPIQFGAFVGSGGTYETAEMYLDGTGGNMVIQAAGTGAVIFQAGGMNQAQVINGGFSDLGSLYLPGMAPSTGSPVTICLGSMAGNGGALTLSGCPAGSGANTSLSNLANPTAVNQSLIPGTTGLSLGEISGDTWASVFTGDVQSQGGLLLLSNRVMGVYQPIGIGDAGVGNAFLLTPASTLAGSSTILRGAFYLPDAGNTGTVRACIQNGGGFCANGVGGCSC